jgi:hypothetical protein
MLHRLLRKAVMRLSGSRSRTALVRMHSYVFFWLALFERVGD